MCTIMYEQGPGDGCMPNSEAGVDSEDSLLSPTVKRVLTVLHVLVQRYCL